MTKDEAAKLLDVAPDIGADELRRRYETLHNDYQVRLTNAPTPNLKKAYQKNLQDLREACETLHPGFVITAASDLPISEPTHVTGAAFAPRPAPPAKAATARAGTAPAATQAGALPRSTMVAAVVAVLCATLASLILTFYIRERGNRVALEETASQQAQALKALQSQFAADERILQTGKLEVCNRSSRSVRIESLAVMYREADGKMKTVHSGTFGYPTWTVQSGGRARLQVLRGGADDWDGSAAFYAIQLIYEGAEPFIVTGLVSDAKEGCVNLYLD